MDRDRLTAFTDGVIAVIITIMVLELKAPHGTSLSALLEQWPSGATIFLRLRVDARGYVTECAVDHGSGVASIDSTICNIAHDRLRFRPAVNRNGQAVAGWFGYAQRAPR